MVETVPIWEKVTLTVEEAMAYSGIGEKSLRKVLKEPSCPFAFSIGSKIMIKRKEFIHYISEHSRLY